MTDILLDTNALLWLVTDPDRLAPSALDILGDPANNLYVSAASAWEIAIKTRLGRWMQAPSCPRGAKPLRRWQQWIYPSTRSMEHMPDNSCGTIATRSTA